MEGTDHMEMCWPNSDRFELGEANFSEAVGMNLKEPENGYKGGGGVHSTN